MPDGIHVTGRLGTLAEVVQAALARLEKDNIVGRIWSRDHIVWKSEPTEITNRLGWLEAPGRMKKRVPEILAFVHEVRANGFEKVVLLGMGGSSLAPEVLSRMFSPQPGFPTLTVLDTTHPEAVFRVRASCDLSKTLFVVATKSGGTVETLSLFKYFYNQVSALKGTENPGAFFCAITDPGSGLEALGRTLRFRKIFLNDPDVGGRYSALTLFGLVPAALVGIDVQTLLQRGEAMAETCRRQDDILSGRNPGLWLGAVLGAAASQGQDKLTLVMDPSFANLADWVEQLIAESTGKEGKGIVPVVHEPPGRPEVYGPDRFFVRTLLQGNGASAVPPVFEDGPEGSAWAEVHIRAHDVWDAGGLFFLWEFATVVAGHLLGIHPFDQPDVESAKVQAKKMLAAYLTTGSLPQPPWALRQGCVALMGDVAASTVEEALRAFVDAVPPEGYIGVHAYVAPSSTMDEALQALQEALRNRTKKAVTVGYGPRFLHSTGQLHKGDAGKGIFLQVTDEPKTDLPIPDEPGGEDSGVTFGTLVTAQALGDREALLSAGRPVLRLHILGDAAQTLRAIALHL